MFSPQQVKQFKEAFNMMDQDGDGRVTEEDLCGILSNLGECKQLSWYSASSPWYTCMEQYTYSAGQTPTGDLLDRLLTSRPGGAKPASRAEGINFTQFLAMMGERLLHLDPEHDLLEAFACFDDGDKGWVDVNEVRKHLAEMGDHMSEDEVSQRSGAVGDMTTYSHPNRAPCSVL